MKNTCQFLIFYPAGFVKNRCCIKNYQSRNTNIALPDLNVILHTDEDEEYQRLLEFFNIWGLAQEKHTKFLQ